MVKVDDYSEGVWPAKEITKEDRKNYFVRWEGVDPATGKAWRQSWIPKYDCSEALIDAWEEKKSTKSISASARRSGKPPPNKRRKLSTSASVSSLSQSISVDPFSASTSTHKRKRASSPPRTRSQPSPKQPSPDEYVSNSEDERSLVLPKPTWGPASRAKPSKDKVGPPKRPRSSFSSLVELPAHPKQSKRKEVNPFSHDVEEDEPPSRVTRAKANGHQPIEKASRKRVREQTPSDDEDDKPGPSNRRLPIRGGKNVKKPIPGPSTKKPASRGRKPASPLSSEEEEEEPEPSIKSALKSNGHPTVKKPINRSSAWGPSSTRRISPLQPKPSSEGEDEEEEDEIDRLISASSNKGSDRHVTFDTRNSENEEEEDQLGTPPAEEEPEQATTSAPVASVSPPPPDSPVSPLTRRFLNWEADVYPTTTDEPSPQPLSPPADTGPEWEQYVRFDDDEEEEEEPVAGPSNEPEETVGTPRKLGPVPYVSPSKFSAFIPSAPLTATQDDPIEEFTQSPVRKEADTSIQTAISAFDDDDEEEGEGEKTIDMIGAQPDPFSSQTNPPADSSPPPDEHLPISPPRSAHISPAPSLPDVDGELETLRTENIQLKSTTDSLLAQLERETNRTKFAESQEEIIRAAYQGASQAALEIPGLRVQIANIRAERDRAETRAKEGVQAVKILYDQRVQALESQVSLLESSHQLLLEKERRTDSDEVRKKASRFDEYKAKVRKLELDLAELAYEKRKAERAMEDLEREKVWFYCRFSPVKCREKFSSAKELGEHWMMHAREAEPDYEIDMAKIITVE